MSVEAQPGITVGRAALIAAVGLLAMTIVAPLAHFGVVQPLIVPGDAAATWTNLVASETSFRLAVCGYLIVIVADVVVAWALYVVLRPADKSLSLLAAWLRLVYSAGFAAAVLRLVDVLSVFDPDYTSVSAIEQQAQAMQALGGFIEGWAATYVFFGLHLAVLGVVVFRCGYIPKVLGVLLFVAGVGYLIDVFGGLLSSDYDLTVASMTFIGEPLLMLWLFVWGWRLPEPERGT